MRCLPLLVLTVSALMMATLAFVTQRGEAPHAAPASPTKSNAENRKPGAPAPGLGERLADSPQAALEWLLQTSGREQSSPLCSDAHLQSAVIDTANRLMQAIGPQSGQGNPVALGNFVQLWAAVDLRSAYGWVHQIPAGQVRNALMVRVAFVGSQIAPGEAASLVVEEIPSGVLQEEAAMMVLHQWALRDPDSAAAWVNLFPDDSFRDRALRELQGVTNYQRISLSAP